MFTGLIEETGTIHRLSPTPTGIHLVISANLCARRTRVGDSVAVNGACLTVVKTVRQPKGAHLHFDLLQETWNRTSLHQLHAGSAVNLERALAASGRLGGHFVTGHIDGVGIVDRWEKSGADRVLEITTPPQLHQQLVSKGSVAVDGISLTVSRVTGKGFQVWIIPHTYEVTALRERQVGEVVNLETDLLGKYVLQFMAQRR